VSVDDVALGVTEAQLMEAVYVLELASDLPASPSRPRTE
jgi:hypothetical protein